MFLDKHRCTPAEVSHKKTEETTDAECHDLLDVFFVGEKKPNGADNNIKKSQLPPFKNGGL